MKIELESWNNVSAAGVALLQSDKLYPNAVEYIATELGGTVAPLKSEISRIQIKLGTSSKPIWDVTGDQLNSINKYEGRPDTATVLLMPFTNPRAKTVEAEYQGALNLGALGIRRVQVELTIAGGTAPTLRSWAEVSPPGVNTAKDATLFRALLTTPVPFSGALTRRAETVAVGQAGGAVLRRLFMFSAIVTSFQLDRDGVAYFEDIPLAVNNAILDEYGHDPQPDIYVFDAIEDDNESKALTSIRKDEGGISQIPQQYKFTTSGAGTVPVIADIHTTINGL